MLEIRSYQIPQENWPGYSEAYSHYWCFKWGLGWPFWITIHIWKMESQQNWLTDIHSSLSLTMHNSVLFKWTRGLQISHFKWYNQGHFSQGYNQKYSISCCAYTKESKRRCGSTLKKFFAWNRMDAWSKCF